MQAPNAQGLAGLMSRPQAQPQPQQPMPSPERVSPMAGLGSVEDRVSAYRGNPAPLQQRYAMSQDLLDLLALQKIKSEKEAAARQMQLSMGQQAAAQGGEPPTIAQQREKEVMDMTKNELAQQRGATANQQVSEQQVAMQRMMGGVASAPGAATAAQPKMMATGGIVGFQAGGRPEDEEQTSPAGRAFRGALASMQSQGVEQAERRRLRDAIIAKYGRSASLRGLFTPQSDEQRAKAQEIMGRLNTMSTDEMRQALSETPTPTAPMGAGAGRGRENPTLEGITAAMRPADVGPQNTLGGVPTPTPKPTSTPAPQAGLAALPGVQGAPAPQPQAPGISGTPTDPLAVAARKEAMGMMGRDPTAGGLTEEQRVEQRLQFPEEQARRRAAIDEQRKLYEQEFDPERQRRESLKRFLIGAGGRAYGELGAGATSAMGYEDEQSKARQTRLKAMEDMEQGLFSLKKGAVEGGIGAGRDETKRLGQERESGLRAAVTQYGAESTARQQELNRLSEERRAELSRQVQMAQAQIQRESNQIAKSSMSEQKLENLKLNYLKSLQNVQRLVEDRYAPQREALMMDLRSNDPKRSAAAQKRMQELDVLMAADVKRDGKLFLNEIQKIQSKLSGTGGIPPGIKIEEITE